jgi:hypothetical protein
MIPAGLRSHAYVTKEGAEKKAAKERALGFRCKIEKVRGNYIVYSRKRRG